MPNPILGSLSAARRAAVACHAISRGGSPCGSPAREGTHLCAMHTPDVAARCRLKARISRASEPVVPDLDLPALSRLDCRRDDHYALARQGVWQHLLAGSIDSTTARTALQVAREIHDTVVASSASAAIADIAAAPPARED